MNITLKEIKELRLQHPYCQTCGWRKGGVDSWNGDTCKCGHSAPAIKPVKTDLVPPDQQDDLGRVTGERFGSKSAGATRNPSTRAQG